MFLLGLVFGVFGGFFGQFFHTFGLFPGILGFFLRCFLGFLPKLPKGVLGTPNQVTNQAGCWRDLGRCEAKGLDLFLVENFQFLTSSLESASREVGS